MNKINLSQKGFTLVELMVTIGIMALLTGIITANLTSSRQKARDAKRISDVGQIQLALELVFDRCNKYPAITGSGLTQTINAAKVCTTPSGTDIFMKTFLDPIPTPPVLTTQSVYNYGINAAATDYIIMGLLEGYSEVLKDDLDGQSPSFDQIYAVPCSGSNNSELTSERKYCLGS